MWYSTFYDDYLDHRLVSLAIQYFLLARFGSQFPFNPASGSLYHLSFELLFKSYLIKNGVTYEELKNKFGHNLVDLFIEFKKKANINDMDHYVLIIKNLDSWEKVRYIFISKGQDASEISITSGHADKEYLDKVQEITFHSQNRFLIHTDDMDELFFNFFSTLKIPSEELLKVPDFILGRKIYEKNNSFNYLNQTTKISMPANKAVIQKCIEDVEDRIVGVFNDLKAYIYIRSNNLQSKEENIGGGNIVTALSLFSCLNFLSKVYYCTVRPNKFNNDGSSMNETEAFIHFMKFIQQSGLDLGLPSKFEILELVWNGFRNWLAHRLIVQPGKQVINFTFELNTKATVKESLLYSKNHRVFESKTGDRNWTVNCDVLLSYLPDIVDITTKYLRNQDNIDTDLLLKVIGTEYP